MRIKNFGIMIFIITILIFATACQQSPSAVLKTLNSESNAQVDDLLGTLLVQETIEGDAVSLNFDISVLNYGGIRFNVYKTDMLEIDFSEWTDLLFPGKTEIDLIHFYDGLDDEELANRKANEDYRTAIFYFSEVFDQQDAMKTAWYDKSIINSNFGYINFEAQSKVFDYDSLGYLRREQQEVQKADESEIKNNEEASYNFYSALFGDEFTDNFELTFSELRTGSFSYYLNGLNTGEDNVGDIYLVAFDRIIDGLPILFDDMEITDGFYSSRKPDTLEAFIEDGDIVYARGMIRELIVQREATVISASEALNILKVYFETLNAVGEYDIETFELMYYPNFVNDDQAIYNAYGGESVEYIPVWTIASGERYLIDGMYSNGEFVMIINAETGEVIRPKKR